MTSSGGGLSGAGVLSAALVHADAAAALSLAISAISPRLALRQEEEA